jgi:hypothetical protein
VPAKIQYGGGRQLENHIKFNSSVNFYPIFIKFLPHVEKQTRFSKITKPEVENQIQDGYRRHFEKIQIAIT